ncbi:MAG: HD domain-containing protein [Desulfoferrobacter sp.]
MDSDRLEKQIRFIVEIDKLKSIVRQTLVTDGSRQEDSAEHSWHIAVMAIVLSEYAKDRAIDIARVLKMALIHDLVEIDAGDTYCYDEDGNEDKLERERKAAERIFGLLPKDQSEEFRRLWDEFELRETAEARFAAALDRLQPLLNNYSTNGRMWQKHRIKSSQVFSRNRPIEDSSPTLWKYAADMILDAISKDWLAE